MLQLFVSNAKRPPSTLSRRCWCRPCHRSWPKRETGALGRLAPQVPVGLSLT